jgi:bifunctional DNase/RNase
MRYKKHVEMRAVGLTVDAELKFPLLMLKSDATGRVFPLSLDTQEKNFLINTLLHRRNLYTGVIRGIIGQCRLRLTAVALDENEQGTLAATVTLRGPRRTETVTLDPKEGVILAMEYGLPVQVAARLLDSAKYYTRAMPPETVGTALPAILAEPWFAEDDDDAPTAEKEDTLQ